LAETTVAVRFVAHGLWAKPGRHSHTVEAGAGAGVDAAAAVLGVTANAIAAVMAARARCCNRWRA
jgi:hypothetical protein